MITKHELNDLMGAADESAKSVLTVYLGVDPLKAANANRGFEARLHRLLLGSKPSMQGVAEAKRFMDAAEHIRTFVSHYQPQRRTLILVYDQADSFFWIRELAIPMRDIARWDFRPYLNPLEDAMAESERYAVALVGDVRVRLFKMFLGEIEEYIKPAGEAVHTVDRVVKRENIDRLILAGSASAVKEFRCALPRAIDQKVIGSVSIPFEADPEAVLRAALPLIERFEQEQDEQMVRRLISGEANICAVTGLGRTLELLNQRHVWQVVYAEGLRAGGYECRQCKALFSEDRERCPYCKSPLLVIDDLAERMLERASEDGVRIHVLRGPSSSGLSKVGGIAALPKKDLFSGTN